MRTADCGMRNWKRGIDVMSYGTEYSVLRTKHEALRTKHRQLDRARQGQRGSNLGGHLSDGMLDETQSKASAARRAVFPESHEMFVKYEDLRVFERAQRDERTLPKGNIGRAMSAIGDRRGVTTSPS